MIRFITSGANFTIIMVVIGLGVASFFVVPMIRGRLRTERITEHGLTATARVISLRDTGNRVNGQPVAAIALEVQPPGGAAFSATAETVVTAINAMQVQPGKQVSVRYDPANHGQVVIVGAAP